QQVVLVHHVRHGDVDVTAAPGALCCEQGGQDAADRRLRAAEQVADLEVGDHRLAVARGDLLQHAGIADVVDVVPGAPRVGAVLPVAADRAHHQARVDGAQIVPAD